MDVLKTHLNEEENHMDVVQISPQQCSANWTFHWATAKEGEAKQSPVRVQYG